MEFLDVSLLGTRLASILSHRIGETRCYTMLMGTTWTPTTVVGASGGTSERIRGCKRAFVQAEARCGRERVRSDAAQNKVVSELGAVRMRVMLSKNAAVE